MTRNPDDPNDPTAPVGPRAKTRTRSPTSRPPLREASEPSDTTLTGSRTRSEPSDTTLTGSRTRTRSISIGSMPRGSEKSRTKTRELPPQTRDKTKLVIELDDPGELIGFLEQIIHVLKDNKSKKITLVIEE